MNGMKAGASAAIGFGLAVALGMVVMRPGTAIGSATSANADLALHCINGNLTVELALDPSTGPANSSAWSGPIKNVDQVVLFDKWALLRKRDLGTDGTLIVPREKIVFINIGQ